MSSAQRPVETALNRRAPAIAGTVLPGRRPLVIVVGAERLVYAVDELLAVFALALRSDAVAEHLLVHLHLRGQILVVVGIGAGNLDAAEIDAEPLQRLVLLLDRLLERLHLLRRAANR